MRHSGKLSVTIDRYWPLCKSCHNGHKQPQASVCFAAFGYREYRDLQRGCVLYQTPGD